MSLSIELQHNAVTGNAYEGRNQAELIGAKAANGFKSNKWATFLQARGLGLKVKKGSHGVSIFKGFASFDEVDNGKRKTVSRPVGFARVFNLDQTEEINF